MAGARKREGDWRAPAGVFRIGGAWGYDAAIQKHPAPFIHRRVARDRYVQQIKCLVIKR